MPEELGTAFSYDTTEESTGYLLWQVTSLWQRAIRTVLKPLHLTQVQYVLLASLSWMGRSGQSVNQAGLARHTKLDVMMTSQVLRTLEQRSLLRREKDPADPRANMLFLTESGNALAAKAIPLVETTDRTFFERSRHAIGEVNAVFIDLIGKNS